MAADDDQASRRARIAMLVRQRKEKVALPEFADRLAAAGAVVSGSEWIRLPERDVWFERYQAARRRVVHDPVDLVVRRSETSVDFARDIRALGRVVDHDVVAIPRSDEVGCFRLTADRFAELAVALLDADGDDVSVISTGGDDGAHLTMYDESGALQRELQVWGEHWGQSLSAGGVEDLRPG